MRYSITPLSVQTLEGKIFLAEALGLPKTSVVRIHIATEIVFGVPNLHREAEIYQSVEKTNPSKKQITRIPLKIRTIKVEIDLAEALRLSKARTVLELITMKIGFNVLYLHQEAEIQPSVMYAKLTPQDLLMSFQPIQYHPQKAKIGIEVDDRPLADAKMSRISTILQLSMTQVKADLKSAVDIAAWMRI